MLSRQEEERERRAVLKNDARVREQSSTYLDQHHSELGGRYAQIQPENVVGSTAQPYSTLPKMPEGNPWAGPDLVGLEPPLGYRIDDLNPSDPVELPSFSQQETDPTSANAPNPLGQRAVVGSLSNKLDRRF
jgi:hypothetical protein